MDLPRPRSRQVVDGIIETEYEPATAEAALMADRFNWRVVLMTAALGLAAIVATALA